LFPLVCLPPPKKSHLYCIPTAVDMPGVRVHKVVKVI
jgi:hypothetical protein